MATLVRYPLLTAEEFPEIDFGDHRAELDNGVIRMMAGGTARTDLSVRIPEYTALSSVDTIVLIDIATERLHVFQRTPTNG